MQKIKVVFLGEQSVGKTSIITKFCYDSFERAYQATIGVDFLTKEVSAEDRTVRMQLWDTAGQERFRSLIPAYIRDSTVAIVVYDITNMRTFDQMKYWVDSVRAYGEHKAVILMVGNKTDLNDKRQVSSEEARDVAEALGVTLVETSAKTGFNVNKMFRKIVTGLPKQDIDHSIAKEMEVRLHDTNDIVVSPAKGCLCLSS